MGSFEKLILQIGVEGIPAFKGAFKDAIEALETTQNRAVSAGNSINKAFANLGVADASSKVAAEAKKLQNSFELLEKSFKDGKISAADFAKAQDGIRVSLERLGSSAEPIAAKIARIGDAFKGIGVSSSQFQISGQIDKLKGSLNELEKEFKEGSISAADFARAQKAVGDEIGRLNKTDFTSGIEKLQDRLGSIAASAKSLGSTLTLSVTAPIVGFAGAAIKAAADMESLEIGLRAVTKDAGPLEAQLRRLQEVAKLPGLGFKEAVQGSINLQAAGFSANTAERALKAFGNALATVGKGRVELDGVVTALSQIASKGKISAEEINQLAERLPQIRVAIKDAFGPGFTDAKAFEQAGITSEIFVEKIIAQFEKLPKAAGGFKNDLENLRDTAEQTLAAFGKTLIPFASSALKSIQPFIETLQSAALQFAQLPAPIQSAAVGLAAFTAAAGPALFAFGGMADGAKSLIGILGKLGGAGGATTGITSLTGSLSGLGSALLALGPAAAVAASVAAVGFGIVSLKPQADELIALLQAVAREYKDYIEALSSGADAAKQPFVAMGEQSVALAGFLAELSPAFVAVRAGINAFKEDAVSASPVFGDVAKAFEEMKARFTWTDLTGVGMAIAAIREFGVSTIDVIKRVTGVYPEMAEAAERNLRRVQKANADAMRLPTLALTGAASVQSDVASNIQELKTAQETLKLLKSMKASKEELAEATVRVTNAQRKLHPELTATGSAAGGASKGADELGAALKRLGTIEEKSAFNKLNDDIALIDKAFAAKTISASQYRDAYQGYFEQIGALNKKEADAFAKLGKDAEKAAFDVSQAFAKAVEKLQEDYKRDLKPVEITLKLKDQIGPALFEKYEEAVKNARALERAFKVAGVSQASLVDQADDLAKAYEEIARSVGKFGGATQGQANQARARFLEAEVKAQRELNGEVQRYQEELTEVLAKINDIKSADDAYRNAGLDTLRELQVEADRAAKAYEIIGNTGRDSAVRILTAQMKALEAQREVAIATGQAWDGIDDQLQRVAERLKRATDLKGVSDLQAAFRNFANDAGSAITKSFGDAFDSLIKGDFKGVGNAFKSMWKGVAESAVKAFTDPLKNALATFFGNTVRDLLKGSLSGITEDLKDLASVIKGLFRSTPQTATGLSGMLRNTPGATPPFVPSPSLPGAPQVPSARPPSTGGTGGGASSLSSIASIANIANAAFTLAAGIGAAFQASETNKTLDTIGKHTLQTANDLANLRRDEWDRAATLLSKLDDLAQFTWTKLDDIVTAVRGISITGVTAGEGGALTGIEPLLSAITAGASSIVAAIQGLSTATGAASVTTQTVVLSSVQEMTNFLAKLTQDQAVAFEGLPPEIKEAINAGKIADLVTGQDQFAKDAIADYLKITNELKQVREAINSLRRPEATSSAPVSSAYNPTTGTFDPSQVRTTILPSSTGFEITSYLGAIGALSDRMAGYWERLFEVLAGGVATVTNSAAADALKIADATSTAASATQAAINAGTVSTDLTTAAVGLTTSAVDTGAAKIIEQTAVIRQLPGFARGEDIFPAAVTQPATDYAKLLPSLMQSAYVREDAPYIRDLGRQAAVIPPALAQSLLPTAPALYPPNTDDWKAQQSDWMRAPNINDWKPDITPSGNGATQSYSGTCGCVITPPPPQLPIVVQVDGWVLAEAMARYNEKMGYR